MTLEIKNTGMTNQIFLDEDGITVLKTLLPGDFIIIEDGDTPPSEMTLDLALASWNIEKADGQVPLGGALEYISDTGTSGGSSNLGRTYAEMSPSRLIRQSGRVNAFDFKPSAFSLEPNNWRFKLMRPSGTDLIQVGQGDIFTKEYPAPNPAVVMRHVLNSHIQCQPLDSSSVWMLNVQGIKADYETSQIPLSNRFTTGDVTTLSIETQSNGWAIDITPLGSNPFYVVCGDSLEAGHNEPYYRPFLDNGFAGDINGEITYHLSQLCAEEFRYQNWARGGVAWPWAVDHLPYMVALGPKVIEFAFGINDIYQGRTWSQTEASMNFCKTACDNAGIKMVVREVLPETASTDIQAAATRDLNSKYATWCSTNNVDLILCHDVMGQIRPSTGELDDLKTEYNLDGTHLKQAGVVTMGGIKFSFYNNISW